MKKHLVWAALAALMVGMLSALSAAAASAHTTASASAPCREALSVPLSTAQGKADALKILGPKAGAFVVAHMHQRYYPACATPSHSLSPNTVYTFSDAHWGGYFVDETNQGTNTNAVASNFNAEFVTCSSCSLYEWVGIGGVNGDQDLAQAGVSMNKQQAFYCLWDHPWNRCDETGTPSPTLLFNVSSGDNMYGYVARTAPGVWEILIEDTTKGGSNYYQNTFSFSPDHTTADWIVETSTSQDGTIPQFADITFGGDDWWDSNGNPIGYIHTLGSAAVIKQYENYVGPGQYAYPLSIYDNGQAFTYYWGG